MRRRGMGLGGLSAAGLALAVALPALAGSGAVGGPPTFDFNRCDRFLRPCGPPIVLGKPRHFLGRVEVIGMHFERGPGGLCLFLDTVRAGSGHGACGPESPLPPEGDSIQVTGLGGFDFRRRPVTQIEGQLTPEVIRVRAAYWRRGERVRRSAAVVQVSGELQERIEEPEPFGIFELTVRGCIARYRVHLTAYGPGQSVLQRIKTPRFRSLCRHRGGTTIGTVGARTVRRYALPRP